MYNSEKKIVKKIIQRDEKTLFSLFKTYKKSIYSHIYKSIKDQHIAEEITQDVFIDFIEALRDFHHQSSIKTFLFSIAKHKTIDYIRKKKIKKILFSSLPLYVVEGLKTILIDDEIDKHELQQKIASVFDSLPNDYRLVLRLKYIEGEKVSYIAQKLSLGFKATESLIFRARKSFIKIFSSL